MELIKNPSVEKVIRIKNDLFEENTYIYKINDGRCLLIDPGFDAEKVQTMLLNASLAPVAIICTHGHFDHIASVKHFQTLYGCPFYIHDGDSKLMKQSNFHLKIFNIDQRIEVPVPDIFIKEDTVLEAGSESVEFIHTPGHTPGSCLVKIGNSVFSGDTIYKNKVDYTNLPGMNQQHLLQSVLKIWNTIPDDAIIYPGHGASDLFKNIKLNNHKLRTFIGLNTANSNVH